MFNLVFIFRQNKAMIKILYFIVSLSVFMISCSDNSTDSANQSEIFTQIDFEPSFISGGSKILYVHSDMNFEFAGIKIKDLSAGTDSLVINSNARCPQLSPDSKWMVYSINNYIVKVKFNGESQSVLKNTGINFFPKWSSDGSRLLFADIEKNSQQKGVWIINSDGSNASMIEEDASFPAWADSNNTIVFFKHIYDNAGNKNGDLIVMMNIDGSGKKIIYALSGNDHLQNTYLNYFNGEYVFSSLNAEGLSFIYKLDINRHIIKLTSTQGWSPAVNSSGTKIIYTNRDPGNGRLWEMDINGNGKRQITQ